MCTHTVKICKKAQKQSVFAHNKLICVNNRAKTIILFAFSIDRLQKMLYLCIVKRNKALDERKKRLTKEKALDKRKKAGAEKERRTADMRMSE